MNLKATLITLLILAVIGTGILYVVQYYDLVPGGREAGRSPTTINITYNSEGFSPKELSVVQGDTVRFVNLSESDFWPASALHPTHDIYPNTHIDLCESVKGGACPVIIENQVYSAEEFKALFPEVDITFIDECLAAASSAPTALPVSPEGAFDACGAIPSGQAWEFTFNEVGEWGYHDHLNPSLVGKVIVE